MSEAEGPPGSPLCTQCRQMTATLSGLKAIASKEGYKHLLMEEIYKSADLGCQLCSILRKNHSYIPHPKAYIRIFPRNPLFLSECNAEKYRIQSESKGHPFEIAKLEFLYTAIWDDNVKPETKPWMFGNIPSHYVFTGADDPAANFLAIRDTTISVTGSQMLKEIKALLSDCSANHNDCPKPGATNLPSRVIDVRQGDHKELVRLHITEPQEKAEYICLSYRWGGPQSITTTTATLPNHKLGIPISTLPRTLQDAIQVTRDLGFRYLWVDALCIIQDSTADITSEINRMGTIYKSATVTIAAANTTSAHGSFLATRTLPGTAILPYLLPNGTFGNLYLMDACIDWISAPLNSRAWALQESLLSPRILWYGPADLRWKCQTAESENVHKTHGFQYEYAQRRRLPSSVFGHPQSPDGEELDIRKQQYELWRNTIEDYSARSLTFASDRLPALAGVVAELGKLWKDDYVAGLWWRCLVSQLAWYSTAVAVIPSPSDDLASLHLPAPGAYPSPSWSWTSYIGGVSMHGTLDTHAEVISCDVNGAGGGKLVLNAAWISEDERLRTNKMDCFFKWDWGHCAEQDRGINMNFRYVLLGYRRRENKDGGREGFALVLAPIADGAFMRIGMVRGFSTENWPGEALERRIVSII